MRKRFMVVLVLAAAGCTSARPPAADRVASPEAARARQPNVIVILADDLGYGDTGVYGSTVIRTPHIDALAASGVRFTSGYVTHPVCSPSRAALMTGRYQQRYGYEFNPVGRDETGGVSLREVMMAQIMKSAGYRTGMVGKWHLGQGKGFYPTDRGFDEFFGMAAGGTTFITEPQPGDEFFSTPDSEQSTTLARPDPAVAALRGPDAQRQRLLRARERFPITRNGAKVRVDGYVTDVLTDEATRFIDENAKKPFFLYMAYNAPHTPLQATKKYVDRYRDVSDPGKRVYAAMVSALDDGVGRIVAKLKQHDIGRDTLVVFLSDNGCAGYLNGACSNAPFSGYKGLHLEGGVRVPFIMAMPGRIGAGQVDDRAVSALNILPTAAALAGTALPAGRAYDGIDMMPFLTTRKAETPNPTLYWRSGEAFAIRHGNWKMWDATLAPPGSKTGYGLELESSGAGAAPLKRHAMLYDLARDSGERENLAPAQRQRVDDLRARMATWNRNLLAPQWPSRRISFHRYDGQLLEVHD